MQGKVTSTNSISVKQTRILIVDDHPIVRRGFRAVIETEADLVVCGEAEGMSQAMQLFFETAPDVVVTDISIENGSGVELVRELCLQNNSLKILVCSMHDETLFAERALQAGAKGYINKEEAAERLVTAIRRVAEGHIYLSDQMTERMLNRSLNSGADRELAPMDQLSDRELEVFQLIGHGLTTRQIAEKLHLSPKTIETYRENIKRKLNLANSVELTRHAVQWVLENA